MGLRQKPEQNGLQGRETERLSEIRLILLESVLTSSEKKFLNFNSEMFSILYHIIIQVSHSKQNNLCFPPPKIVF